MNKLQLTLRKNALRSRRHDIQL